METFFFSANAITAFLRENKAHLEKYDEFVVGLILSRLYTQLTGVANLPIGFNVKPRYFSYSGAEEGLDLAAIKSVIDEMKEDSSPIDIIISLDQIDKIQFRSPRGVAFQIKRFRENVEGDVTDPLIQYLNHSIPRKYAKANAHLVLFFEHAKIVDLARVSENFNLTNFPFKSVKFVLVQPEYIWLGEIAPRSGMDRYPLRSLWY